jgi:hypothetical protein
MDPESGGNISLVDRIKAAQNGTHIGLFIFILVLAQEFVERIDKDHLEPIVLTHFQEARAEIDAIEIKAAQVPDSEVIQKGNRYF